MLTGPGPPGPPARGTAALPARAVPAAEWGEPLRLGLAVGGLVGAAAGLAEAALVAHDSRRVQDFTDLFGYAVLIDAALFGLLAGVASALTAGLARVLHRRLDPAWLVALVASLGCLLAAVTLYVGRAQLTSPETLLATPRARPDLLVIPALGAALTLLTGVALIPRRRSGTRALCFGRRIAPIALAALVALSAAGVLRDLSTRGLTPGDFGAPEAAPGLPSGRPGPEPRLTSPAPTAVRPTAGEAVTTASSGAGSATELDGPSPVTAPQVSPTRPPSVLLVTIDTLREDHIGPAGYANARTATLDRLAAEGVHFARNFTNRNATTPAHASIFTGTYPSANGVRTHMLDLLKPGIPTLAEVLSERGYVTAGMYSWLAFEPAYSGLDRGFQVYRDMTVNLPDYLANPRSAALAATYKRLKTLLALPGTLDRQLALSAEVEEQLDGKADVTTDGAILWLREYAARPPGARPPFFLWVHYWDPHYPYTPPPPFDQIPADDCADCLDGGMPTVRKIQRGEPISPAQVRRLLAYYDGEIAFTDRELDRLLRMMGDMGLADNTVIVVMGDHGESFGEHGRWLHGTDLYDPEVHVPLIMRFPGHLPAGVTVDAVTQSIDVMPTILDLLGMSIPTAVEGRSLQPLARGDEPADARHAIAELADRSINTIVTREWQLLQEVDSGTLRLYRTADDPLEQQDRALSNPEDAADLRERLERWEAAHP